MADLDVNGQRVENIHLVLNADPFFSSECLSAADAVLLSESSFSVGAASVSANLKLYFLPRSRRPLVLKARNWVKILDDHDASVQDRSYALWHQLDLNLEPPFQDASMLQTALRGVLEKVHNKSSASVRST